jgi:uncharacterized SAM-binding protein YcdF (DUF218 family)
MEILITRSIEALLLPPGSSILLLVLGLLLSRRRGTLAVFLIAFGTLSLYVLSLPVTAQALLSSLETYPALQAKDLRGSGAQAIVVLGTRRYANAPEYLGDTVAGAGLERLRYAVRLHKETGLPLVLSGGSPLNEDVSEALLMKQALLEDYGISAGWAEQHSPNTAQNAFFTKHLLDEKGIKHIYLVTHAWHMRRALKSFEEAGLEVTPAPTRFYSTRTEDIKGLQAWLPRATALEESSLVLHEYLGSVWYSVRYAGASAKLTK